MAGRQGQAGVGVGVSHFLGMEDTHWGQRVHFACWPSAGGQAASSCPRAHPPVHPAAQPPPHPAARCSGSRICWVSPAPGHVIWTEPGLIWEGGGVPEGGVPAEMRSEGLCSPRRAWHRTGNLDGGRGDQGQGGGEAPESPPVAHPSLRELRRAPPTLPAQPSHFLLSPRPRPPAQETAPHPPPLVLGSIASQTDPNLSAPCPLLPTSCPCSPPPPGAHQAPAFPRSTHTGNVCEGRPLEVCGAGHGDFLNGSPSPAAASQGVPPGPGGASYSLLAGCSPLAWLPQRTQVRPHRGPSRILSSPPPLGPCS
ncbi:basic proline-rich protein-like [Sus scrofa]|uniref:basic proline-rich protein-like n=1 Tax=Sus scrofa TaxID=9823 RepID=UPI000A2B91F4|nr:basic proline-rich protein-like [Sus scrofa]